MAAYVLNVDSVSMNDTGASSFSEALLKIANAPISSFFFPFSSSRTSKSDTFISPDVLGKGQESPSSSVLFDYAHAKSVVEIRNALYEQILSFKSLDNNWDGFGAYPVSAKCAALALSLINFLGRQELDSIDDIFPNTNGSITIKWVNLEDERLTLSVGSETFAYYFKKNGQDVEFYNYMIIDEASVASLMSKIQSIICNV